MRRRIRPVAQANRCTSGDTVTVSEAGIAINGKLLSEFKAIPQGCNRAAHASSPAGTYPVLPGTVWVISSYNRFSFDSRYFGPIHLDERVQYAKPFWLF
jgi:type IV secretory pathway protease TraF